MSAYFMEFLNLRSKAAVISALWLSSQDLILVNCDHKLMEEFLLNYTWCILIKKHILQKPVFETKKLVCLGLRTRHAI